MNNKKITVPGFILVVLVQLFVPAKMIYDKEKVALTGTDYKFKTAPVDPGDPFRGKYILLNYEENSVKVSNPGEWASGETAYVSIENGSEGFAKISSVSKNKPGDTKNFIRVKVSYASQDSSGQIFIEYPFDRFYMEESKAPEAEVMYNASRVDTAQVTYAVVSILNGEAVLKDVLVNGVPISAAVKARIDSSALKIVNPSK